VTSAPSLAIALHERMIDVIGPGDARLDDLRIQMLRPLAEVGRAAEAIALADELLKGDHDPVTEGRIRVTRYQTMQRIEGRMIETIPGLQDLVADERLPPPLLRRAKRALAAAYMLSGHADPARSLAEALLPEARKARDNESVIGALSVLGAVNVVTGNIADATAQLGEVVELETREPSNAPHPHAQFASALMLADRFAEARQTLAAGRRRDAEMGRSSSLASYASVAAMIGFFEGTWDDAFAEAETAIDLIGQRVGSALMSMCAHCCLIQVALRRGQLDRAERFLADAEDAVVRVGPSLLVEFIAWSRALYQEVCGDLEAASGAARNAWQMRAGGRRPIGWRWMAGDVVRLALATGDREAAAEVADAAAEAAANAPDIPSMQGTALLCRGLLDDDPDLLVAAAEAYARAPGRVEHAWASEHAAVALARHGRTAEARRSFAAALAAYDDVGATHDAARCTAAARAAGIRRGSRATRQRPVVGWAALTDKEREVARMAAGGLTNPQIAERLFVSKYTVMTHLSHVFAKLGISSRVELAAVAGRESS
jgi:ATP/maltotriose-dependent transcriptional regulator MalT